MKAPSSHNRRQRAYPELSVSTGQDRVGTNLAKFVAVNINNVKILTTNHNPVLLVEFDVQRAGGPFRITAK